MVNTKQGVHSDGRAALAHEGERGASLFIVLMILMILTAIGTFAATNARFETQTAGFERQRTVTHEVTNFGGFTAMQELGSKPRAYSDRVKIAGNTDPSKKETCTANGGLASTTSPNPPCFHLYLKDVENGSAFAGGLISPPDPSAGMPGSLGLGSVTGTGTKSGMNGGYVAEVTEIYDSVRPVVGYQASEDGKPTPKPVFYDFTITANGYVFYDTDLNGIIDPLERGGSTFGSARGHVVIGPVMQ